MTDIKAKPKRKRKEKSKNRPSARRQLTLFMCLVVLCTGFILYVLIEQQSETPVLSLLDSTPDYEGICDVTDEDYFIEIIEPAEDESASESDKIPDLLVTDTPQTQDLQITELETAINIGDPLASQDGQIFAITWADKSYNDPERRVHITWADVLTGETHTLRGDFKSAYDLLWSADNDWLAYTYWRDDDTGVEIINRPRKEIVSLVTNAQSIDHKEYDETTGIWTVWWTDFDDKAHVGLFDLGGEKLFGMQLYAGRKNPRTWTTYTFPSPTGDEIIFKLVQDEGAHEYLVLLDADGDMKMLADNVQGLGDPDWSSDGQYVLWSHYRENAFQYTVSIADAEGERLWQTKLKDLPQLIWTACD